MKLKIGMTIKYTKNFAFGKQGEEISKVVAIHPNRKALLENGDTVNY